VPETKTGRGGVKARVNSVSNTLWRTVRVGIGAEQKRIMAIFTPMELQRALGIESREPIGAEQAGVGAWGGARGLFGERFLMGSQVWARSKPGKLGCLAALCRSKSKSGSVRSEKFFRPAEAWLGLSQRKDPTSLLL